MHDGVMKADYEIIQGDCLEVLRSMPSESVHCYSALAQPGLPGRLFNFNARRSINKVSMWLTAFRGIRRPSPIMPRCRLGVLVNLIFSISRMSSAWRFFKRRNGKHSCKTWTVIDFGIWQRNREDRRLSVAGYSFMLTPSHLQIVASGSAVTKVNDSRITNRGVRLFADICFWHSSDPSPSISPARYAA